MVSEVPGIGSGTSIASVTVGARPQKVWVLRVKGSSPCNADVQSARECGMYVDVVGRS